MINHPPCDSIKGLKSKIMKTFKEIKNYFTERAFNAGACEEEYDRLESAKNKTQSLNVIKDNVAWAMGEGMSIDDFLLFGKDALEKNHIYIDGIHNISVSEKTSIVLFGSSQATVETRGSSQAKVETRDSSKLEKEVNDYSVLIDLIAKEIFVVKGKNKITEL